MNFQELEDLHRATAGGHLRTGSSDRCYANRALEGASSPGSWAHPAFTRKSGTLFFRWCELDLLWRQLLTAKNPSADIDVALLRELGLQPQAVTPS